MNLKGTLIICLLLFLTVPAVRSQDLHTRSNRALKFYDLGKRDYEMLYHDRAERNLLQAVEEDRKFYEAHLLLGQLYSDQGAWEKAISHYRSAISIDSLYFTPALYSLGRAEMRTGRYAASKSHLEAYLKQPKISSKLRAEAEKYMSNCIFALSFNG
ncbi:MAG: tetratricopeptide repeat protein, partial [Bacteroidales bacterium]|nr:tetratricopeptide repeat protein [Bacteroidales bacterium]